MTEYPHISVLLPECVAALAPAEGEVFVDCTLGMGGHTEALLQAAPCTVVGIDRDPAALAIARERMAPYGDRFIGVQGSFGDLDSILDRLGMSCVDGVLADLGVSSLQLDTADRGFSFRAAGPVDMRMNPAAETSAADLVNDWKPADLIRCIATYGEEKHARRIVKAIVAGRPWEDTRSLADAIDAVVPQKGRTRIHPATRTFQALRIVVNDEIGQLEQLLETVVSRLCPAGRLAIISFHSLEDRPVKRFIARESGRGTLRDPWGNPQVAPRLLSRSRPILPAPTDPNPRARSARLRTAVKVSP